MDSGPLFLSNSLSSLSDVRLPNVLCQLFPRSSVFSTLYQEFSLGLYSCLVLSCFLTSVSQMSFVNCFQGLLSSLLCIKNFLLVFIRVLSFICWGVSSVHCLVSVVVFCLLSVVMCALPSVFVKCLISNVLCLFFCHMSFLYCHFSFIFCQLSFLFCHLSSIFCQLSCRVSFAFCPSLHLLSWNLCISIGQDLIASL